MEQEGGNDYHYSLPEATEYVRQQLSAMGVENVTEKELEAYTRDFIQLLREKEDELETSEDESEAENIDDSATAVTHSPAVYKTILSSEECDGYRGTRNVITTDSPSHSLMGSYDGHVYSTLEEPILQVITRTDGNRMIKRKVLSVDVKVFTVVSLLLEKQFDSAHYSADVSDYSISTVASGDTVPVKPPKSFIRPPTAPQYCIRGTNMRKSDPVQRYHEYNESWKTMKPPGEKPRHRLRWHIREQLLLQDDPAPVPPKLCSRPNEYVVPTTKKRQGLRWEIRHQLAN